MITAMLVGAALGVGFIVGELYGYVNCHRQMRRNIENMITEVKRWKAEG